MLSPPSNQCVQLYSTTLIVQSMSLQIADAVFVNQVAKAAVNFVYRPGGRVEDLRGGMRI